MNLQRNLTLLSAALALSLTASLTHAAEHHKKAKNQTTPAVEKSAAPRLPETTNRYGITMVTIPAGNFLMGSCTASSSVAEENKKRAFLGQAPIADNCNNPDPRSTRNEWPQHPVNIQSFQIGKTEVTLSQFRQFIAATGNSALVNTDFINANNAGDNAPVVAVSWHHAQAFINWLNQTEGGGYRLPTESEWEFACRAGSYTTYCGSNDVVAVAWYDSFGGRIHPVARKQANAFGLYDMSGNAPEWVQDTLHDNYNGAPSDGSAWSDEDGGDNRMVRGGYWNASKNYSRAAFRHFSRTEYGNGFRVARTLP